MCEVRRGYKARGFTKHEAQDTCDENRRSAALWAVKPVQSEAGECYEIMKNARCPEYSALDGDDANLM